LQEAYKIQWEDVNLEFTKILLTLVYKIHNINGIRNLSLS